MRRFEGSYQMKRCMYCGQVNEDSVNTCTKCGNPLLDTPYNEDGDQIEEFDLGDELMDIEPVDDDAVSRISFEEPEMDIPSTNDAGVDDALTAAAEDTIQEENIPEDIPEDIPAGSDEEYFDYEDDYDTDVQRGQGYAARAQYAEEDYQPYGGQDYEYDAQADGDQQYGGQAYGYDDDPQQYGRMPEYDEYSAGTRARVGMTPLMQKAHKRVKSFLFFLATLFFTVHVAAQIVNVLLGNWQTNLSTVSNTLLHQFGPSTLLTLMNTAIGYINSADRMLFYGIFAGLMLPQVLILFGLWGMFLRTSRRTASAGASGYTLTTAGVVIQFILVCLALLASIVAAVSFVVAAGASGSTMSLIVGVVILLVVIILAVLVIMYHIQLIYAVRVVKRNVRTGEYIGKIPGFAIFCGILLCAVTVVTMLPMAPDDYLGLVTVGASAAWLLFISLWAIVYRATVKEQ